eukprot:GEMP01086656.1.p1 GENE.GEMP01086656.1~~GEMP01086656.1.p1  ORF type:complete len:242 (+),score=49.44 GEMP01086656.1:22-726(+)
MGANSRDDVHTVEPSPPTADEAPSPRGPSRARSRSRSRARPSRRRVRSRSRSRSPRRGYTSPGNSARQQHHYHYHGPQYSAMPYPHFPPIAPPYHAPSLHAQQNAPLQAYSAPNLIYQQNAPPQAYPAPNLHSQPMHPGLHYPTGVAYRHPIAQAAPRSSANLHYHPIAEVPPPEYMPSSTVQTFVQRATVEDVTPQPDNPLRQVPYGPIANGNKKNEDGSKKRSRNNKVRFTE